MSQYPASPKPHHSSPNLSTPLHHLSSKSRLNSSSHNTLAQLGHLVQPSAAFASKVKRFYQVENDAADGNAANGNGKYRKKSGNYDVKSSPNDTSFHQKKKGGQKNVSAAGKRAASHHHNSNNSNNNNEKLSSPFASKTPRFPHNSTLDSHLVNVSITSSNAMSPPPPAGNDASPSNNNNNGTISSPNQHHQQQHKNAYQWNLGPGAYDNVDLTAISAEALRRSIANGYHNFGHQRGEDMIMTSSGRHSTASSILDQTATGVKSPERIFFQKPEETPSPLHYDVLKSREYMEAKVTAKNLSFSSSPLKQKQKQQQKNRRRRKSTDSMVQKAAEKAVEWASSMTMSREYDNGNNGKGTRTPASALKRKKTSGSGKKRKKGTKRVRNSDGIGSAGGGRKAAPARRRGFISPRGGIAAASPNGKKTPSSGDRKHDSGSVVGKKRSLKSPTASVKAPSSSSKNHKKKSFKSPPQRRRKSASITVPQANASTADAISATPIRKTPTSPRRRRVTGGYISPRNGSAGYTSPYSQRSMRSPTKKSQRHQRPFSASDANRRQRDAKGNFSPSAAASLSDSRHSYLIIPDSIDAQHSYNYLSEFDNIVASPNNNTTGTPPQKQFLSSSPRFASYKLDPSPGFKYCNLSLPGNVNMKRPSKAGGKDTGKKKKNGKKEKKQQQVVVEGKK